MDVEDFRNYCLSLGDVEEKMPFGKFAKRYESLLVFYVKGHMFAYCDIDDFSSVGLRSTVEEKDELKSKYEAVEDSLNRSLKFWIQIEINSDVSDLMIYDLVKTGYSIIKEKYD